MKLILAALVVLSLATCVTTDTVKRHRHTRHAKARPHPHPTPRTSGPTDTYAVNTDRVWMEWHTPAPASPTPTPMKRKLESF